MAPARGVQGKGGDLSRVVEQSGPAQGKGCGDALQHVGGVGNQIVGVVGAVLVKADHGRKFRDHCRQDWGEAGNVRSLGGEKKFT